MKTWLTENEPYLRGLEVAILVVFGSYISYLQLGISQKQAEVAEQSLKVSKAELELIERQTDIQRMAQQPYFTFRHTGVCENYWPCRFSVSNRSGGEVRSLRGDARVFILLKSAKGDQRILLAGFYDRGFAWPKQGELAFHNPVPFIYPKFFGLDIADYGDDHLRRHVNSPERYKMPFEIFNYVEVSYVGEDSQKKVQRFVMNFPDEVPTPVSEEPKYSSTFDVVKYRDGDKGYKFQLMFDDFQKFLKEQSGGAIDLPRAKPPFQSPLG